MTYTSKKFSQRIAETGFKGEATMWWEQDAIIGTGTGNGWTIDGWKDSWRLRDEIGISDVINSPVYKGHIIKSYDIIYDICIKYPKQFFGEEEGITFDETGNGHLGDEPLPPFDYKHKIYPRNILSMLQEGKTLKEIEDYIEKNSILFNK